jgi:biopolymer transport protein TolR
VQTASVKADINVTPLVDVVLVLLIIFMVVTPLVQRGYTIDVPRGGDDSPASAIVLRIDHENCPLGEAGSCRVGIAGDTIDLQELPAKTASVFERRTGSDRILFVSADDSLNYEMVLRIVDAARSAVKTELKIAIANEDHRTPVSKPTRPGI